MFNWGVVFSHCRKSVVIGAGYIAVELAGILNALGSETHSLIRYDQVLRTFDQSICQMLTQEIIDSGINLHQQTQVCATISLIAIGVVCQLYAQLLIFKNI